MVDMAFTWLAVKAPNDSEAERTRTERCRLSQVSVS